jgi:hypothetical protein
MVYLAQFAQSGANLMALKFTTTYNATVVVG